MIKNIIEKISPSLDIVATDNRALITGNLTDKKTDLGFSVPKKIGKKEFETEFNDFVAVLPANSTIDEKTGYLMMHDAALLEKQGGLLLSYIANHGKLPRGMDREYVEKVLFGAAFKVKDANGDSALTLACAEIEDKELDKGFFGAIRFNVTNDYRFLKEIIGKLIDFGNADEVFLQDAAKNTAASILLFKHEPELVKKILGKNGVTHQHILSINYFYQDRDLLGDLRGSSKFETMLEDALSTLSDKQFMQYWAMRKDIMFSQSRSNGGFRYPIGSQHINDDYGPPLRNGMWRHGPYISMRLTTTFTDIMENELAKRKISKEALHYFLESDECKQYLASQKQIPAPKDPEPKEKIQQLALPCDSSPSASVKEVIAGKSKLFEDKSNDLKNTNGKF